MIEHLSVIGIRQNFSAVAEENDAASLISTERFLLVHINVITTIAVIKVVMHTRTTELS
jgi:hypothetical protein